jgi:hypothetical protein
MEANVQAIGELVIYKETLTVCKHCIHCIIVQDLTLPGWQ